MNAEAYCEEVYSAGFWPGTAQLGEAAFYAYAVPEPRGFRDASGLPPGAYYDTTFNEFLLPWTAVRTAPNPRSVLRTFFQATYSAAADLGRWNRAMLERPFLAHPPRESVPVEADRSELLAE